MKLTGRIIWWFLATVTLLKIPDVDAQIQVSLSEIKDKFVSLEHETKSTLELGCSIQIQSLATYIQAIWWPHIQYLTSRVTPKEQKRLLIHYNRLLYLLGRKKCESPFETLFDGKCHRIGIPGNPCPKYQQLYDNQDNTGFCYCQPNTGKVNGLIYMENNCYMLNEQGPCKNGEWLTVKENVPICEQAPPGCPVDGQHIYWSCNDGNTKCERHHRLANMMMKCSKLGSRQPSCGQGARLFRIGRKTYCGLPRLVDLTDPNVSMAFPSDTQTCPLSSGQSGKAGKILELTKLEPLKETTTNNSNKFSCPTNYYRDVVDGRCKKLF